MSGVGPGSEQQAPKTIGTIFFNLAFSLPPPQATAGVHLGTVGRLTESGIQ